MIPGGTDQLSTRHHLIILQWNQNNNVRAWSLWKNLCSNAIIHV